MFASPTAGECMTSTYYLTMLDNEMHFTFLAFENVDHCNLESCQFEILLCFNMYRSATFSTIFNPRHFLWIHHLVTCVYVLTYHSARRFLLMRLQVVEAGCMSPWIGPTNLANDWFWFVLHTCRAIEPASRGGPFLWASLITKTQRVSDFGMHVQRPRRVSHDTAYYVCSGILLLLQPRTESPNLLSWNG